MEPMEPAWIRHWLLHVYLLVNHNTMYNVVVCSPEQSYSIAHSSMLNTLKWDLIKRSNIKIQQYIAAI